MVEHMQCSVLKETWEHNENIFLHSRFPSHWLSEPDWPSSRFWDWTLRYRPPAWKQEHEPESEDVKAVKFTLRQWGILTAVDGTMWFLSSSRSLLRPWRLKMKVLGSLWWIAWKQLTVEECWVVLTSALLRYCRCPSVIASKAELSGAKTVIGPGRSRTDTRSTFCRTGHVSKYCAHKLQIHVKVTCELVSIYLTSRGRLASIWTKLIFLRPPCICLWNVLLLSRSKKFNPGFYLRSHSSFICFLFAE